MELLRQIADGIAAQFGSCCEVVVHDVGEGSPENSIVYIVNGHVSGRKIGDGGSNVVLEQWLQQDAQPEDHLAYLTRSTNGKVLRSSTMYIRNDAGWVEALLSINFDISSLLVAEGLIRELISPKALVGKPVALMNKEDKVRAIQFLNRSGAFLVTKSGDKVAKYFGISKYTLYSYIDTKLD